MSAVYRVYALQSGAGKFYIGFSENVTLRVHNRYGTGDLLEFGHESARALGLPAWNSRYQSSLEKQSGRHRPAWLAQKSRRL